MADLPVAALGSRAAFPTLSCQAYLAHAAVSPASLYTQARAQEFLQDTAERGVGAFPRWLEQRERLRAKLARLISAPAEATEQLGALGSAGSADRAQPDEIALMPNTTRGVSDIALSVNWRPGDRVLLFRGEFPTNVTPWQRAAELFGLELRWLDVDRFRTDLNAALGSVADELSRGVRLLAISAVQFQTGLRAPLEQLGELCQRFGCEFFVDGIQACGVVPVDVKRCKIDYLACGSHKWLMGPEGAGFLYVNRRRTAALIPRTAGWLSHQDGLGFLFEGAGRLNYDRPFKATADVFEGGMSNALGFAVLEASVDPILSLGVEDIFEHVSAYLDELEAELCALGLRSLRADEPSGRSGILAFREEVNGSPKIDLLELQAQLAEQGIVCTAPDGCLRFAPHWPNSRSEISALVRATRELI